MTFSPARRSTLISMATLAALPCGPAFAQDPWPSRPVRIIVPYAAGGPVDAIVRALARDLQEEWKQPVIIDNRPGANEIIGADLVAKSPPDGYTLLAATEAALTMSEHLYSKLPYNPAHDFVPLTRLLEGPLAFVVPSTLPVNDIKEYIALARRSANAPLSYGSAGAGGISHLPMVTFAYNERLTLTHIAYKGAAATIPDLITNRVQSSLIAISVIEPYLKAGTLKALAVSSSRRVPALPAVPTFEESGVKDIQARFNLGLLAPRGTAPAIADRVAADCKKVLQMPKFREKNIDPFSYVVQASTPREFASFLHEDRKQQGVRIKLAEVKLD